MAHDRDAFTFGPADNLLGAEFALEQFDYGLKLLGAILLVTAGAGESTAREFAGCGVAIVAIMGRDVARCLSINCRAIAIEGASNLRVAKTLGAECRDGMSLLIGNMFVAQEIKLMHLLPESKPPNQALEPTIPGVTPCAPSCTSRAT